MEHVSDLLVRDCPGMAKSATVKLLQAGDRAADLITTSRIVYRTRIGSAIVSVVAVASSIR